MAQECQERVSVVVVHQHMFFFVIVDVHPQMLTTRKFLF